MEVTLGKHKVTLKKPTSFMSAREVTIAVGTSALRGLGAALGVCWTGKALKASLSGCKYDTLAYGGAVVDELVALGVTEAEIYTAGKEALDLVLEAIPREPEVATVEGFTDPQTEPSTP
jgi:hypothetical protein